MSKFTDAEEALNAKRCDSCNGQKRWRDRIVNKLTIGKNYTWKGQPERLIYLGNNWSGNGYWHQFAKVESPEIVWCDLLDSELKWIEETKGGDSGCNR